MFINKYKVFINDIDAIKIKTIFILIVRFSQFIQSLNLLPK